MINLYNQQLLNTETAVVFTTRETEVIFIFIISSVYLGKW